MICSEEEGVIVSKCVALLQLHVFFLHVFLSSCFLLVSWWGCY